MSERKPGWYWVRIDDEWGCMCWTGKTWSVMDEHMDDAFFDEIGSRIPKPDEPWTTVPVQPDEAMIDAVFWAWSGTDVRSIYIDMISSAPKPENS